MGIKSSKIDFEYSLVNFIGLRIIDFGYSLFSFLLELRDGKTVFYFVLIIFISLLLNLFLILPRHDFNFSAWVSFVWIQKQCLKVRETLSFVLVFTIFPVFIHNVRPNIRYLSVCINLQHSLVGYKCNNFLFSVSF